jgi:integrase
MALQRFTVKTRDGKKHTETHLVPAKAHSRRTITLPKVVLDALRAHRARQLAERELCGSRWRQPEVFRDRLTISPDFVFTTPIGTPLDPCNLNKTFQTSLKGCGIGHHRYHDLRHTAATLLKLQRVPDRAIMEILGWSQLSMLERYTHVLDEMRQDAATKMNDVLTKPVGKKLVAPKVAPKALLFRVK